VDDATPEMNRPVKTSIIKIVSADGSVGGAIVATCVTCTPGAYDALGQEDNRNRRPASPTPIARKLMLLDITITRPDETRCALPTRRGSTERHRLTPALVGTLLISCGARHICPPP
jgi:hypothetical protein